MGLLKSGHNLLNRGHRSIQVANTDYENCPLNRGWPLYTGSTVVLSAHDTNVATTMKQRVFSKAMISNNTEVIFVDEANESTLDLDDWKVLKQGGYDLDAM